jgi:hypothetical protein
MANLLTQVLLNHHWVAEIKTKKFVGRIEYFPWDIQKVLSRLVLEVSDYLHFFPTARTTNKQKNSAVLVRKRTLPTERPPLVGEVSANFCG